MHKLKIMKNYILLLTLLSTTFSFAQNENRHECSKRDAFSNAMTKSNSLNLGQIAETERYDVHYYDIDIGLDNLSTYIDGTVEIHGTARENLDSVLFELFDSFTINEILLNGTPTVYSRVQSAIKVPVNLTTGQPFIIAIAYYGTPPNASSNPLGGSGMTNYSSPTWSNQVTWSLSEPFSAYEWWPCKQSLTDKADSCAVKLTVPNTCKAGSNGVLEAVVDLGNGTSRYEWKHRHPIDYYLISVAVAEYVEYNVFANPTGSAGPVLIQNYIYNNPATLPNFQSDIDETVDFMELFANLFGPYPFDDEKYGHCMAPLSGGMEHQTMTTQGYFNKGLTSHELGHQWWGNNVTCASWADIWINEGFASYSAYLMLENLYPPDAIVEMNDTHANIMSSPGGSTWVLDSLNTGRIFSGRLSYDKGSAIIHTFRFIMDDDILFFQALQDFQTIYADSTAYGLDMRDMLQTTSGIDYTEPFNEWYFGEGFPTYSVVWNDDGTDLSLGITHTTSSSTPTFTNPLEVKFSRIGAPDTTIRFDITGNNSQFFIPNIGNVSNVVSIDPNNWIINDVGTIDEDPSFVVGVQEIEVDFYSIYPNPSSGEYTISTNDNGLQEIILLDTKGRTIIKDSFNFNYSVDITTQENGYYILQLIDASGNKRIKTIVKN